MFLRFMKSVTQRSINNPPANVVSFDSLPVELLLHIGLLLDPKSYVRLVTCSNYTSALFWPLFSNSPAKLIELVLTCPAKQASLIAGDIRHFDTLKKIEENIMSQEMVSLEEFALYTLTVNDITKIDSLKLDGVIYQLYLKLVADVEQREGVNYPLDSIDGLFSDSALVLTEKLINSLIKTSLAIKRSYLQNKLMPIYEQYKANCNSENESSFSKLITNDPVVLSLYQEEPIHNDVYSYENYHRYKENKRVSSLPAVEGFDNLIKLLDKYIFKGCTPGLDPRYCNLSGANLSYLDLSKKSFKILCGYNIENARLDYAQLQGKLRMSGTNVKNASMKYVNLYDAIYDYKKISKAKIYACNFLYSMNADQKRILDSCYAALSDAEIDYIEKIGIWLAQQTVGYLSFLLDENKMNIDECLDFLASIKSHALFTTQSNIQYTLEFFMPAHLTGSKILAAFEQHLKEFHFEFKLE